MKLECNNILPISTLKRSLSECHNRTRMLYTCRGEKEKMGNTKVQDFQEEKVKMSDLFLLLSIVFNGSRIQSEIDNKHSLALSTGSILSDLLFFLLLY